MSNLFNFEYSEIKVKNLNDTDSRFSIVYGQEGNVIHTKKDSYHIVKTNDVSELGNRFIEQGYKVDTFVNKSGEDIGLTIDLGEKPTVVGAKQYKAIITVPNDGSGKGYLAIKELRLICTNGAMREFSKNSSIKIPHTIDYLWSIKAMGESIKNFDLMIKQIELKDQSMNDTILDKTEVMYHLNKWFFDYEFPATQKAQDYTFDDFRKDLYENTENIKSYDRYLQLKAAFEKELSYNTDLSLKLSLYTVYATITNYLTRRIEKSNSVAPSEIQYTRVAEKMKYFETLANL